MAFLFTLFKPLAYLSVPVFVLRHVAASTPVGRYYIRLTLYVGALGLIATYAALASAVMTIVGQGLAINFVVARTFYAYTSRLIEIQIEVEEYAGCIDYGKSVSKPRCYCFKQELRWSPLGLFMTLAGAIFVDRGNSAKAIKSLATAGELMKSRGNSVWIFPEGTRHCEETPNMLPLKKGGFHLAVQAGIPVVPIVVENYWRLYHAGVFEAGTLKVKVLPPIPTTGLTAADIPALAERVRDQMLSTLREISVQEPSGQLEKPEDPSPAAPAVPERASTGTPIPDVTITVEAKISPATSVASPPSSESLPASVAHSVKTASENGTETEEDEGMVLVGRPA